MARRYLIPLVILATVAPACLFPQEEEQTKLRLRFQAASLERIDGLRYALSPGGPNGAPSDSEPIAVATSGRPVLYDYEGPNPIVFYRKTTVATEAGGSKVRRNPVARAEIPEGTRRALLFFFPSGDQADRYRILPVPLSTQRFSAGDFLLINAADFNVAVAPEGKTPTVLDRGESTHLRARDIPGPQTTADLDPGEPAQNENLGSGSLNVRSIPLRFAVRTKDDEWQPLNFTFPLGRPNEIRIVLILPPAVQGSTYLRHTTFRSPLSAPDTRPGNTAN